MLSAMSSSGEATGPHLTRYEIVFRGELGESFSSIFGEPCLEAAGGKTRLIMDVIDQAQLHGVLNRMRDCSLELESLRQLSEDEDRLTTK
jgi:hypothetical protein